MAVPAAAAAWPERLPPGRLRRIGSSGGGIAGSSASATRRADTLTHTESFFLFLTGETFAENAALWAKLSDGATVIASLPPAGSAPTSYGITWIFCAAPA